MPWPPKEWHPAYQKFRMHSCWYSGDPNLLAAYYGGVGTPGVAGRAEGFFGTELSYSAESYDSPLWRRWMFWSKRTTDPPSRYRLHIPLPADIAQTSADLLFSEPPAIIVPEAREVNATSDAKAVQDAINEATDEDGIDQTLLEAAEIAAALGGVYLRVTWDQSIAEHPLLTAVHPDAAVPEFAYGRLVAVTFWAEVGTDGDKVYRHLERHEAGYILHGLYEGNRKDLGWPRPLSLMPATAGLLAGQDLTTQAVGAELAIETRLENLTAVYVPNVRPNREDRRSPLGRSDYAGVEGLFDALDEGWSSWMRDLRLARARILVPYELLDVKGKGQGAAFDADQEVFQALNAMVGEEGSKPELVQPNIRTAEHLATTTELIGQIVRTAGYSPASFGLPGDGRIVTATEIAARERRSLVTRGKKASYWTRPLTDILMRWLELDNLLFGGPVPMRPQVQFADSVSPDPKDLATSLQLLKAAASASCETRVRLLHPDWDEEQVQSEVARIQIEEGITLPDMSMPPNITTEPAPNAPAPNGQQPQPEGEGQPATTT